MIRTRKIAILAAPGVDGQAIGEMKKVLVKEGAMAEIIAPQLGQIKASGGEALTVNKSLLTVSSVLYDAVYLPGGGASVKTLLADADAIHFINQDYKHCKALRPVLFELR